MGNSSSSAKASSEPKPNTCNDCVNVPSVLEEDLKRSEVEQKSPVDKVTEIIDDKPSTTINPPSTEEVVNPQVEDAEVLELTKKVESVTIVEEEEKSDIAVASPSESKKEEDYAPSEFDISHKALKLDSAEDVAEMVAEIKNKKNLQIVSLIGNTLGIEASKALASALEEHPNIRVVNLSDCFTGRLKEEVPVSVAAFGSVLVKKKNLETVMFSDNAFGPIGAKALVELLSGSPCLQDLILNNNGLGPEGGRIIAEALIESKSIRVRALRKVLIGRNRLENGSSAAFAKMLQVHDELEEFAIPQCGVRSEGIITLCSGLVHCKELKTLDLQDNTFTSTASKSFSETLPSLEKLMNLNIGDCMCESEGSIMIMNSLLSSSCVGTLENFNFQYNEMDEEGALALAKVVPKLINLKTLILNGNAFNPEGNAAKLIREAVGAEVLDDWSDMEYDEDGEELSDAGSGFITEKERGELIVESESEDEEVASDKN